MKGDAFDKFAKDICEFLDHVNGMPVDVPLQFTVDVKKIKNGLYHLSNPKLAENVGKKIIHN
jgi:hypothetical protein